MQRWCGSLLLSLAVSAIAFAHPGNGIVVQPDGSVITGDAVRNGIWKFAPGRAPEKIVSSFHCHWVVAGKDGHVYAETVAERGGNWFSTHYRLNVSGGAPIRQGPDLAGDASRFAVDGSGARIFHLNGSFVRASGSNTSAFRGGGSLAKGEPAIGSIAALAWGPQERLYFAEDVRVRTIDRTGIIRTVVELRGRATSSLMGSRTGNRRIWGMDVSPAGDVLIADASTGQVLRCRDGRESVVARARDGWVATGVAASGNSVYVLETKQVGNRSLGPRVRKISADGRTTLLGQVSDSQRNLSRKLNSPYHRDLRAKSLGPKITIVTRRH